MSSYEPLLGTVVELRIHGDPAAALDADRLIVDEIRRLELVFSVFDETSELCRWRRGDVVRASAELTDVLRLALHWQTVGGGSLNPASGELSRRWAAAERGGSVPPTAELAALADAIRQPRYSIDADGPHPIGDCSALNLNAIAKGYIVDLATDLGRAIAGIDSVVVNAGGDLAHRGSGSLRVGIEDPSTPYDNAPPLLVVEIDNCGLATSGSARRGFDVGGQWFGHVLDPRSGVPVDHIRSATVIADCAVTADAAATVVGVVAIEAGRAFIKSLDDVECCIVDRAGEIWCSEGWSRFERRG